MRRLGLVTLLILSAAAPLPEQDRNHESLVTSLRQLARELADSGDFAGERAGLQMLSLAAGLELQLLPCPCTGVLRP